MVRKTVLEVKVQDVEKRRYPSKHYVYVVYVTWSDGNVQVIYRRYSRFFDFQSKLLDKFPNEAGTKNPADRIIPFLPGKILLGRSHIRDVALKRLQPIDDYCKALIRLPTQISECPEVLRFFECTESDLRPSEKQRESQKVKGDKISEPVALEQYVAMADYKKEAKGEADLIAGMRVEVFDKTETGWWFISTEEERGWVPSTYLERVDGGAEDTPQCSAAQRHSSVVMPSMPQYVVTQAYLARHTDELSLDKGGIVEVKEKNLQGWWLVRYKGREGLAPAVYLERSDTLRAQRLLNKEPFGAVQMVSTPAEATGLQAPNKSPGTSPGSSPCGHRKITPRIQTPQKAKPQRPPPPQIKEEPVYMTLDDFRNQAGDGISFKRGQPVQVLEKDSSGWWYVQIGQEEGWAPADYIQKQIVRSSLIKNSNSSQGTSRLQETTKTNVTVCYNAATIQAGSNQKFQKSASRGADKPISFSKAEKVLPEHSSAGGNSHRKRPGETETLFENVEESNSQSANSYRVISSYTKEGEGELSIKAGQIVELIEHSDNGWSLVKLELEEGWVPCSHLKKQYCEHVGANSALLQKSVTGGRPLLPNQKINMINVDRNQAKPKIALKPKTVPVGKTSTRVSTNKPMPTAKPTVKNTHSVKGGREATSNESVSVKNLKSMFENK